MLRKEMMILGWVLLGPFTGAENIWISVVGLFVLALAGLLVCSE
jgi:LPXTG-motif cell wall-anchored protein